MGRLLLCSRSRATETAGFLSGLSTLLGTLLLQMDIGSESVHSPECFLLSIFLSRFSMKLIAIGYIHPNTAEA
jgi:hypothetical protein